ncbi:dTDP-4-dehydrorhamnose 3,5-epimerase [Marinomonas sp. CT5]|uniref:dTDP-4-dehydrorhamnose 3,5-epimerase n=1 Tax=Marinomonas sp. CT5 TaxID=2066133 RepID=UPI001BB0BF1D|nr:dTDP-4-dehydrorhamnose 3,5-epimerase [Marinomonas sp. CT5]QUX94559.1 dTDP-4-dehydrorhamnose 3,5-epimerase [Marinomonas sp. CT5]
MESAQQYERLTPLKVIAVPGGDVKHALKASETDFCGFGEAYFSSVTSGTIKGWKLHTQMTCNLIVPIGLVKFVVGLPETGFEEYVIGEGAHGRLTIPSGLWFAFQGVAEKDSLVLNISDIVHEPSESKKCDLDSFDYKWEC